MIKTRPFFATTLASVAACSLLLSGCGGGGDGVSTPTTTPVPTTTTQPTNIPVVGTATANLNVVTTASDSTSFGPPVFVVTEGQALGALSSATINYPSSGTRYVYVSGLNLSTATVGTSYALGSTTTMSASYGYTQLTTYWGGTSKSTGNLVVQSVDGKKVTFQLQNVVLSQSGGVGSGGNSTLAITGTLTVTLN